MRQVQGPMEDFKALLQSWWPVRGLRNIFCTYLCLPAPPVLETSDMGDIERGCDGESPGCVTWSAQASPGNSSGTSVEPPNGFVSPALSLITLDDEISQALTFDLYGRALNVKSRVYMLPADDAEFARQDRLHDLIEELGSADCEDELEEALRETPGVQKAVLDIGHGSGRWMLDVALKYSHVDVVGIDLVPPPVTCKDGRCPSIGLHYIHPTCRHMPSNCRTEVDDVNSEMHHFENSFNVVHARFVAAGITDYRRLIDTMTRMLLPGGVIDIMEAELVIYDAKMRPIPTSRSALARWLTLVVTVIRQLGGEPDAAAHLAEWVALHEDYEQVAVHEWWVQTSPWSLGRDMESQRRNAHGIGMRDNLLALLFSARPMLLHAGVSELLLAFMEGEARAELLAAEKPSYIRLLRAQACKVTL
ncbi:S-adenosyl-L-methionine-dependent methyltransferase [Phanerochaete sordida]|uniref:S-adenosyl-L-methionine-dependent methyltransferase n=1 Tax=Phanerochaete sordida TaxID=48140 RepID=A0A9P3GAD1_9APHY|nr:S-adenosyl-L-methionine-dependent methyltransferase [Phanerochaete sordida]